MHANNAPSSPIHLAGGGLEEAGPGGAWLEITVGLGCPVTSLNGQGTLALCYPKGAWQGLFQSRDTVHMKEKVHWRDPAVS